VQSPQEVLKPSRSPDRSRLAAPDHALRITDLLRKRLPAKPSHPLPTDTTAPQRPTASPIPQAWRWSRYGRKNEEQLDDVALERVQRQTSAKHFQVFRLNAIQGVPVEQVADLAGVKPEQVYVIKNRLKALFEEGGESY